MNAEIPGTLDGIYQWADRLMWAARFDILDQALKDAKVEQLTTDNLLGLLTSMLPVRKKLPSRPKFYEDVERELRARGEFEPGLLDGLE